MGIHDTTNPVRTMQPQNILKPSRHKALQALGTTVTEAIKLPNELPVGLSNLACWVNDQPQALKRHKGSGAHVPKPK